MNTTDLLYIRLYNQLLNGNKYKTPEEIVSWMGAMQSQNYEMAKWGVGIRLKKATNKSVEDAVNEGKIIRTHVLRPTWHFVAAEDIHWMLGLTATRLKAAFVSYGKVRGFDDNMVADSRRHLSELLDKRDSLTRQEIGEYLIEKGIGIRDNHDVTYILSHAEQDGIVCNGVVRGSKQTYSLLDRRAPHKPNVSKEEALERLARKYFTSHGPATLDDYIWWSGLLSSEARKGLELIKHDFVSEEINGKTYWMKNDIAIPGKKNKSILLLPAFDEFVVSYKYRAEILCEEHYRKIITRTGIFSPTITYNGEILGSWKRVVKKNKIVAELEFFEEKHHHLIPEFEKQQAAYELFNK